MWGRLQALHPFRAQSSNPGNIINLSIVEAMPKYIPNSRFSDCWASVGNITFYHRNGQCYFRKKSVCKFSRTKGQIAVSEIHRRALAAWRTLDHNVQLQWNEYAKAVPSHRPPFDGTTHITGHNLFVSAYHGFAQLGDEHIPEPKEWRPFPLTSLEIASVISEQQGSLSLSFKVKQSQTIQNRYRLLVKLQLTSPGAGKRPGYMRTFFAEENCASVESIVTVSIPDYAAIWGLGLNRYQFHCRYTLIDTVTGYRGNYLDMSEEVEVSDLNSSRKSSIVYSPSFGDDVLMM